ARVSSVAIAVTLYVPGATLVQSKVAGLVPVPVPRSVDPLKNCTLLIAPALFRAIALNGTVAGAVNGPVGVASVTVTDDEPLGESKNNPPSTAFHPLSHVNRIRTWPLTRYTQYWPST